MNFRALIKSAFVVIACLCPLTSVHATMTQPKFTFEPLTDTSVLLPLNGSTTVQYRVTNKTLETRTLVMKPITGVSQDTGVAGACGNPFTLASKQSCILSLDIEARNVNSLISVSPEVCKTMDSDNITPDPFLCSRASYANRLVVGFFREPLTITPETLTLDVNGTGSIKVTSQLTVRTANNIAADFTGTLLANPGVLTQDASECVSLAPGESCYLHFTAGTTAISTPGITVPIKGTNTRSVGATFIINSSTPGEAPIAVISTTTNSVTTSGTVLTIQASSSATTSGYFTVQNQAPTGGSDAHNITATLNTALSNAGVTTTGGTCTTSSTTLPPQDTCTLTFDLAPTSSGLAQQPVTVQGTDTPAASSAYIAINPPAAPGVPSIGVTSGTPMSLQVSGNPKSMVVTNSGTGNATGVKPVLTGTLINGLVALSYNGSSTATDCGTISANGGTCTVTFTPQAQVEVIPQSFNFQGTSPTGETVTSTNQGTVSIGQYAYFTTTQNYLFSAQILTSSATPPVISVSNVAYTVIGSPALNNSQGVAFYMYGSTPFVLITTYGNGTSSSTVNSCPVKSNGSFNTCKAYTPSTSPAYPGNGPVDVSLSYNFVGALQGAYFVNYSSTGSGTGVTYCSLSTSGALSGCSNSSTNFYKGNGIAKNNLSSTPYVYVSTQVTGSNGKIYACPVTSPGTFGTCSFTTSTSTIAGHIALNKAGTLLYVTNGTNNTMETCKVNTNGTLGTCSALTHTFNNPVGIALSSDGLTAFVANIAGGITSCAINTSSNIGDFSSCVGTGVLSSNIAPYGIGLMNY